MIFIVSVLSVLFRLLLSSNDSMTRSCEVPSTNSAVNTVREDSELVRTIEVFNELFSLILIDRIFPMGREGCAYICGTVIVKVY